MTTAPLRSQTRRVAAFLYALLPFFGVVVLGWRAADVVTYYWASNVAYILVERRFMRLAWSSTQDASGVASSSAPPPAYDAREEVTNNEAGVIIIGDTPVRATSGDIIKAGLAPQLGGFFMFFMVIASLVQLGVLAGSNYVAWGTIAPAFVLQGMRRLFGQRSNSVARLRRRVIPLSVISRIAVLHFVVLGIPTTAPSLVVFMLCVLAFAAEHLAERYEAGRPLFRVAGR